MSYAIGGWKRGREKEMTEMWRDKGTRQKKQSARFARGQIEVPLFASDIIIYIEKPVVSKATGTKKTVEQLFIQKSDVWSQDVSMMKQAISEMKIFYRAVLENY